MWFLKSDTMKGFMAAVLMIAAIKYLPMVFNVNPVEFWSTALTIIFVAIYITAAIILIVALAGCEYYDYKKGHKK